jgi:aminoglycoside N3'-acetyltransferase
MGLLRYYLGVCFRKCVPSPVQRFVGRRRRQAQANAHQRAKASAITRFGLFNRDQLKETLQQSGIRPGGVLLVQSSFDRFYNFSGTAVDVLSVLEEVIGPDGTLLMPAHPEYKPGGPYRFDVRRTPASTGMLCELFRRRPGVIRSRHPTHSVAGIGPRASVLLADHHKDPLSCGALSPYAKLVEYDGQLLGLGLEPGWSSFLHVVEDLELERFPKRMYDPQPREFVVKDETGQESTQLVPVRNSSLMARIQVGQLMRHVSPAAVRPFAVAGVPCFVGEAKPLLEELRVLRDKGIIVYV